MALSVDPSKILKIGESPHRVVAISDNRFAALQCGGYALLKTSDVAVMLWAFHLFAGSSSFSGAGYESPSKSRRGTAIKDLALRAPRKNNRACHFRAGHAATTLAFFCLQNMSVPFFETASLELSGAVENGLKAVERAADLPPDLVLLDVGLPGLNGIDAAHRIRTVAPSARITFLPPGSSPEIVNEALRLGGWASIMKASAARELPGARDAVTHGNQFVSPALEATAESCAIVPHPFEHLMVVFRAWSTAALNSCADLHRFFTPRDFGVIASRLTWVIPRCFTLRLEVAITQYVVKPASTFRNKAFPHDLNGWLLFTARVAFVYRQSRKMRFHDV